jgi:hypothetical protein
MIKFMLRDKPRIMLIGGVECTCWEIIQIDPEPVQLITFYPGNDESPEFKDVEIAKALAGDKVSEFNEKYIDKNINEEWPRQDPRLYLNYHLEKALEYSRKI